MMELFEQVSSTVTIGPGVHDEVHDELLHYRVHVEKYSEKEFKNESSTWCKKIKLCFEN